jgi:hypothetical protein
LSTPLCILLIDFEDDDVVVAATLHINIDDDDNVSPKNSTSSDSRGMGILESSVAAEVASGKRYELQTRTVPCGLMVYRPQLFDVQWCLFSVELSVSEVSSRVPTLLLMDRRLELRFLRSPLGPHVDVVLPKTIVDDKTTLSYAYFDVVAEDHRRRMPLPCSETDSSTSIQQIHIDMYCNT